MEITINKIIKELESQSEKENSYPYMPEIIATLKKMLNSFGTGEVANKKFREGVLGGLGRLVTEDYNFSESELGYKILEIGEQYLKYKTKKVKKKKL